MTFPVVIGTDTILESAFTGTGYTVAFLDLIEKLANYAIRLPYGTSTTSVTIGIGAKEFTIQTGRLFLAGDSVRAFNSTGNYMEGTVVSYVDSTGVLTVSSSLAVGAGTYSAWNLVPSGTTSIPIPISRGGSPSTSLANLPKALGLLNKNYTTVCESTFLDELDASVPYPFYVETEEATIEPGGNTVVGSGVYSGVLQLSVPSAGSKAFISYGSSGFLYLGDGGDMDFHARILPPVGDGVVARVGFMVDALTNSTDQFESFGFGFEVSYYAAGSYYVTHLVVNDGYSVVRLYLDTLTSGVASDFCLRFSAADKTVRLGNTMESVRNPFDRASNFQPMVVSLKKFYERLNSGVTLKRAGLLRPFFYAENLNSTTSGRSLLIDSFVTTRFLRRG